VHFPGTQMHIITFLITMFEMVILLFQVVYFLERPNDKRRLWYLILLVFLLLYNICSGLLPDPLIPIPIMLQNIIAFLVGFTMSMYFVYYFYKAFDLQHLKFFATYGSVICLLGPFIILFVIPYYLTNDTSFARKAVVVIPFFYGLGFIYYTTRAFFLKFKASKFRREEQRAYVIDVVSAYIALVCWATLPVIVFFGDFQVLEHTVTNAGFFVMTITYLRSSILKSKEEYKKLQLSESRLLRELNFLKHQFNSHITFNFLNYCYCNVYKTSENTAEAIDLFSNMLRYSLEVGSDQKVPLEREVEYINNFIELQRLLTTEVCVVFRQQGDIKNKVVLSRIFVTFVENAFKHGVINNVERPIEIYLSTQLQSLHFIVSNAKSNKKHSFNTGIGNENVKQVLDLYYPDKYELMIKDDIDNYQCELKLNFTE
jgi:sensor histidine kinase YesM